VRQAVRPAACAAALAAAFVFACGDDRGPGPRDVLAKVRGVSLDPRSGSPVVILDEAEGSRWLPIWIGFPEARSIANEMEHVTPPRPNTHDLTKSLLTELDGRIERVAISELREGTYYAVVFLRSRGRLRQVDSRPSDAIALALRMGAPVFVETSLFDGEEPEAIEELEDLEPPLEQEARRAPDARRTGIASATPPAPASSRLGNPTFRASALPHAR
jgi:bifunctional DNase/RNase